MPQTYSKHCIICDLHACSSLRIKIDIVYKPETVGKMKSTAKGWRIICLLTIVSTSDHLLTWAWKPTRDIRKRPTVDSMVTVMVMVTVDSMVMCLICLILSNAEQGSSASTHAEAVCENVLTTSKECGREGNHRLPGDIHPSQSTHL